MKERAMRKRIHIVKRFIARVAITKCGKYAESDEITAY